MKKLIYFILVTLLVTGLQAQTCDIYTNGLKTVAGTLKVGETADLVFNVQNNSKGISCFYAEGSVKVYLSMPASGIKFESIVSPQGGAGDFFTWEYNEASRTIIGINHNPIGDKQGEQDITIRVRATDINTSLEKRTLGLTLLQSEDGEVFPSNDVSNDNAIIVMRITAPQPVEMLSAAAINSECNEIQIKWETGVESGNDFMTIERSSDGINYMSLADIKGTNTSEKAIYSFTDSKELRAGNTYQYRLRQVSTNGKVQFIPIGTVLNDCTGAVPGLDIYPNPAFDKIFVTLKNVSETETVKLTVTNAAGEQVMLIPSASKTAANEVRIQALAPGIYTVSTSDDRIVAKRFLKIN